MHILDKAAKIGTLQVEDPRPIARTRLVVPQKANVAFVQLSAAIVTVSLERGNLSFRGSVVIEVSAKETLSFTESLYQQSTAFKDPVHNPIIGVGFDRQSAAVRSKGNEGNVRLTAFASRSGFIGVEVDPVQLFEFQPG